MESFAGMFAYFAMPVVAFVFMYNLITVLSKKEHSVSSKIISSICFGLITWTFAILILISAGH
ncbi:hypothetical protein [Paenibacillus chitinolyticus]